jgi:CheY-like chemotaxis protein
VSEATSEASTRAQVLVIDDNEVVRKSIARLLESAGLQVITAGSAIGASRTMLRGNVKVAVVDLDMPEMRGSALAELLRKQPKLRDVGIVIVSGVPADELVTAASRSGADAAVSKLDMAQTLVPTVKRLLRKSGER